MGQGIWVPGGFLSKYQEVIAGVVLLPLMLVSSCDRSTRAAIASSSAERGVTVGFTKVDRRPVQRSLTVSSELVPFQEIDVYAKESGFVRRLLVDYGTHVRAGQLIAVLEIPELEAQINQDRAALKSLQDQVQNAGNQLTRIQAQHNVLHLEFERMNKVAEIRPGLVAQQEVDEVQGRDLAAEAQVAGAESNLEAARSNVVASRAKLAHDQTIFDYARITAPFDGIVTQRYANYGALVQAGTNSNVNVLPIVRLSQENLYRLVIPIPETYVGYIRVGDAVEVRVPSLNKNFPGRVARFASEVHDTTRTMHTEVDVSNPTAELIPGLYAEATLSLNRNGDALTIPVQAVDRQGDGASAYVIDSFNKIQICPIVLGMQGETENDVEVLSGLNEGQEVVVTDKSGLKQGESVHAQLAPPATYGAKP
jgi:RND family efflux transporter MFP subunit